MLALINVEAITLLMYFYRDAFAGALRYYLDIAKLGPLWFVPDLAALVCIGVFVYRYARQRGAWFTQIVLAYVAFSLFLGLIFLESVPGMLSSLKMFAPIFVGFLFAGKSFGDYRKTLQAIHVLMYISIVAIIVSKYVTLPWTGYAYESFGAVRQAGRLWWSGGEVRLAGFAADSTMAAFFVLITFVISSINRGLLWVVIWGAAGLYAIDLSTNKTSLGVLAIYIVGLLMVRLFRAPFDLLMLRRLSVLSFLCILIPPALMLVFSGIDLASMSPTLFSMQDRINNSWQNPFVYMGELMPTGYITGCGLGCFNYPQQLFARQIAAYYVPVDNFYIGTLLMFGLPFVAFMAYVIQAVRLTTDPYKLSIVFMMNIFTVTVLSYGPASGLLLIGMGFSNVFVMRALPVRNPSPRAARQPLRGLRQRGELQPT